MSDGGKFKAWWAGLSPGKRNVLGVAVLFGTLSGAGWLISPKETTIPIDSKSDLNSTNLVLPNRKNVTQEGLAAGLEATGNRVNLLVRELSDTKTQNTALLKKLEGGAAGQEGMNPEVVREVAELRRDLDAMKSGKGGLPAPGLPSPSLDAPLPPPVPTSSSRSSHFDAPMPAAEPPKPRLRVVGTTTPDKPAQVAGVGSSPMPYLPAGAMFEGVLLNGMDTPTSSVTQKQPVPALVRIKSESIIPNLMNMGDADIRECFLVIGGHGVLATERAQLRTETLSCVREDGRVIEAELEGYAVGEDGKVGMRGRLVSKQGSMIAKSLVSGFLAGFGQAIAPTQVPQLNVTPGSSAQYQSIDMASAAQAGVGKGISEASKMVAQFYLDMAKEMFPVIEVDAGRKVTIVTIRGIQLMPRDTSSIAAKGAKKS
ncbi:MAG: conjugal transfer protein TraB [Betaproteobacteria bacterium]|nr:conjugal transfer protein TraB [Betaproteobacteria bacterium]